RDRGVREARGADRPEVGEVHDQAMAHPVVVGEGVEAEELLRLRALAVVAVEEREVVLEGGHGRGHGRVHPSADADDSKGPRHTPRSACGQRTLWSWTWRRTGRPSSRIQRARSAGSRTPWTGEKRTGQRPARRFSDTVARAHSEAAPSVSTSLISSCGRRRG